MLPPPNTSGAPITTNLRHAINVMSYRLKTGCQWKMLPKDFGIPWKTVYDWHETFARRGTWERVQRALAARVRVGDGRDPDPSLLSIDSQTVKSAETVPGAGFDGGKRLKGRKRHVLVDTLGLVFAVAVTSAGVSDAAGAEVVLRAAEGNRRWATVLADSAYHRDALYEDMTATGARSRLVIVSKLEGQKVFIPQPMRWRVERLFSWLRGSRLLAREYEGQAWISRSNVYMRSMMLTLNMYQRQQAKLAPAASVGLVVASRTSAMDLRRNCSNDSTGY